ncbi:hypothetical protein PPL_11697 [Heterostelium album PN500]|uniref:Myotrophin n=1 Tax=Heterostelium pallidum (strain ATCC 26659 / Pp 5 / PN500) TaxID=670386 RepID=D3BU78_HETP5|nr:hypothetical protein PPL_11697 [Heterostelium album PN500]EFA75012.1 hypothetical protein PPL_11697 [Heterostelium album PN500]|eukprot:XP_020427146.1 hypothetical protein PPL_11697 [Heterostelium album PN500]
MSTEGKSTQAEEFDWAVKNGDLAGVTAFLQKDANLVNKLDGNKRGPCHWAADFGQTEILKLLISKKANIDLKGNFTLNEFGYKYGITPLLAAVYEEHVGCVELLLKNGADKNATGPDDRTAVEAASESAKLKPLFK